MKNVTPFTFLLISTLLVCGCISQNPQIQDGVKVGSIVPLTGWGAYWGEPVRNGMNIALEEINANPDEAKITLIFEDSKSSGADAVSAAIKLIEVDKVDVITSEFTVLSQPVSPVVNSSGKVLLYDAAAVSILKDNPNAFKFLVDYEAECRKLARKALDSGLEKIAYMGPQNEFGEICLTGLRSEIPNEFPTYRWPSGEKDFRNILTQIKTGNSDVIVMVGLEDEALNIFKQRTELGLNIPIYCGIRGDCASERITEELGSKALNGTVAFDFQDISKTQFGNKYFKKFPGASPSNLVPAATGYEMIWMVSRAAKKCPTHETSCLRQSLLDLREYPSAVNSTGFSAERIWQVNTRLTQFIDGDWSNVDI